MRLTIHQTNLLQSLRDLKRVIPAKPQLPILSSLLIEANDTGIIVSATDLFTGIQAQVAGSIHEPGKVAVPARALSDLVATLPAGDVTLTEESGSLLITTHSSKTKIQCFPAEDYPSFPEKTGQDIVLSAEQLEEIIKHVAIAVAKDESRPILTSVLFVFGDGLEVVATDGFRLSLVKLDHQLEPARLLIPANALQEVFRISQSAKAQEITLTVSEELKQLFCSFQDTQVVVRLMEGDFPPYEKVVPPSCLIEVVFDKAQFVQQLKAAMVFAREASNIVTLEIGEDLTIKAHSPSLGEHQSSMPLKRIQGENSQISFNAQYVQEFLQNCQASEIYFGMNESLQPAIFRPAETPSQTYVVMPFRTVV